MGTAACSRGTGVPRTEALGEWRPLRSYPGLQDRGEIALVPLGKISPAVVESLAVYYRSRLGLKVRAAAPLLLPPRAMDLKRKQLIAEEAITALRASDSTHAYFVGITDDDMYGRDAGYNFTFAGRDWGPNWGAAVVSTARMDPTAFGEMADTELLMARLKKMVTKNLALIYYRTDTSKDPRSVLFSPVLGLDDLDRMGQGF
jgi:predicted Zn-dependent protease